jgi:hypothetical protein
MKNCDPLAEKVELPKTSALQPPSDWHEDANAAPEIQSGPAPVTSA